MDQASARLADAPEPRPADADPHLASPLGHLAGAEPEAPAWFRDAIAAPHVRAFVEVAGAPVEWLAWGPEDAARPGLLLLHGNGANADWWRFIAPFLARERRVAALSWSGMGNSAHREAYSLDLFLAEALAAADAAGHGERFGVPGHSFGGVPTAALAARHADRVTQAIVIDTPFGFMGRARDTARRPLKPHRVYPTLAQALGRFRWSPVQPSPHLFITDFIARSSLMEVEGGFTWKFDPFLWQAFDFGDPNALLAGATAPLAYVWGEQSLLATAGIVGGIRRLAPAGTRFVGIPHAHHHVMADQPIALAATIAALLA
ncbi:MAG: alpha/beta hydrolase [Sphingomonadaceae bacterium]